MLEKLHKKLGDFWWNSLMIFCACRAADFLNAFVGLWLVPKYVEPQELGAVAPLTNFAAFLAVPACVFANTFRNEVSRLSTSGEFGKLKSLMRGVFWAAGGFLVFAVVIANFTLPFFLNKIRIAEGSLKLVVIATAFLSATSPIYSNAVQALKKFKLQSAIQIAGAPVRLTAMLITMPFRALTGYFIGQASVPAFSIAASVIGLRKELSVPLEPYWRKAEIRRFTVLFAVFGIHAISSGMQGLVESTIIRQRLAEIDSAGYYMATRFSEIASYLYAAIIFAFFPFAAELAHDARARSRLILKSTAVNLTFCFGIALVSFFLARPFLELLPRGDCYSAYWWAIPWLIAVTGTTSLHGFFTTSEIAAGRFAFLKWAVPLDIAYAAMLLLVTNHGCLAGSIPAAWSHFLEANDICSLNTMLRWMTAGAVLKSAACLAAMLFDARRQPKNAQTGLETK